MRGQEQPSSPALKSTVVAGPKHPLWSPGGELKQFGDMTLSFGFQPFTWRVTDVTPQNLVMHGDFPNLHWPGHEEEKINEKVGGISGGPVFRLRE